MARFLRQPCMFLDVVQTAWLASYVAALATMPSVLLRREGRPLAALSWVLALLAVPPLALLAWWLIGRTRLQRKLGRRRAASRRIAERIAAARPPRQPWKPSLGVVSAERLPPPFLRSAFEPSGGNRAELVPSPAAAFREWERAIGEARHHVHLLFFIWRDDELGRRFRELLASKARGGVEVRLIVDGVGSAGLPGRFFDDLTRASGQMRWFMQPRLHWHTGAMNFRNHRKLVIVDGRVAFVGGINVAAECLDWSDLCVKVEGPAVDQLQEVFADDWYFCADEALLGERYFGRWDAGQGGPRDAAADGVSAATVASGPDQSPNAIHEALFLTVNACRKRLWLISPYLIPDSTLVLSLRTAVYRGVDVRVVAPRDSDVKLVRRAARAFYPELLRSGVKVLEYAGMVHAKAALFDDDLTLVSSANLDPRSFRLNFEISTFLGSRRLAASMAEFFERTFARSRLVTGADLERRGRAARVTDAAAHLLSPLL